MQVSVIVPTYGRPGQLADCLDGLEAQTLQPLKILVVVRKGDRPTKDALAARESGRVEAVEVEGGYVAALNAGLAAAVGEIVAFTDDDAVPRPDWLGKTAEHFLADAGTGGVGGRDLVTDEEPTSVVGRVTWYGRVVGNHHRGAGPPRPVDSLKGVNMAFRREAVGDLRFDTRLLGRDMQPNTELGFCLTLRRRGWRLFYDPEVLVDHHEGAKHYAEGRGSPALSNVFIEAHNELLGLATGLTPLRRAVAVAYQLIVGTRLYPGPLLALERLIVGREGRGALRRMRAATAGRLRALSTARGRRKRG